MRSVSTARAVSILVLMGCGGSTEPDGPGPGSALTVTIPAATLQSGTTIQATATLAGAVAPNVNWSSSNQGVATISAAGLITGLLVGSATITATSGTNVGSATVNVTPGIPVRVVIYAGDGQRGAPGAMLFDPLCTTVQDALGNRIIGIAVNYAVVNGGGSLGSPTSPATGLDGVAISGLWKLGPGLGEQTVAASLSGATPTTFKATAQ